MTDLYPSSQDAVYAARFFEGRDGSRAVWDAIVREVQTWGPIQVTATQSRVCLKARTRFVWCPTAHVAGTIFVRFFSPTPITSMRGREVRNDTMPDGRPSVRVRLAIDDLDDEVLGWLRTAYEFDVS